MLKFLFLIVLSLSIDQSVQASSMSISVLSSSYNSELNNGGSLYKVNYQTALGYGLNFNFNFSKSFGAELGGEYASFKLNTENSGTNFNASTFTRFNKHAGFFYANKLGVTTFFGFTQNTSPYYYLDAGAIELEELALNGYYLGLSVVSKGSFLSMMMQFKSTTYLKTDFQGSDIEGRKLTFNCKAFFGKTPFGFFFRYENEKLSGARSSINDERALGVFQVIKF